MNYIIDLKNVRLTDIPSVGGKNASLGEMLQNLKTLGIKVPNGFAITVDAYYDFIKFNNLNDRIIELVSSITEENILSLRKAGNEVRQLIRNGKFPEDIKTQIQDKYKELSETYGQNMTDVAVRSSATAEDLPDASFAGQQETCGSYLSHRRTGS